MCLETDSEKRTIIDISGISGKSNALTGLKSHFLPLFPDFLDFPDFSISWILSFRAFLTFLDTFLPDSWGFRRSLTIPAISRKVVDSGGFSVSWRVRGSPR